MKMAKSKNKKQNNKKNIQSRKEVLNSNIYGKESRRAVICIVVVLVIFGLVYLLTNFILKRSVTDYITKNNDTTTLQYDEILSGQSFDKKDSEYLVLFFNTEEDTIYQTLISNYQAKDEHLPIYYVNLKNRMNQNCVSDESNPNATSSSELKINGPTLIKFTENNITEYIEGEDSITEYLK
jgi:hypothetical protein